MSVSGNHYLTKRAGIGQYITGKALANPALTGALLGAGIGGVGSYLINGNDEVDNEPGYKKWLKHMTIGGLSGAFLGRGVRDSVINNLKQENAASDLLRLLPTGTRDDIFSSWAEQ